jgi:hypothetical protein
MTPRNEVLATALLACAYWGPCLLAAEGTDSKASEIQGIFDADQSDRDFGPNLTASQEQWKKITERDEARRKRVRQILDEGGLTTGKDYRQAAFVFQNGSLPADYLLAHLQAMVGVSKGDMESRWIAAAALDRYLQAVKQPQVFGTQYFKKDPLSSWVQEPYDRALFPDMLRKEFCVPGVSQQGNALAAMNRNEKPDLPVICH